MKLRLKPAPIETAALAADPLRVDQHVNLAHAPQLPDRSERRSRPIRLPGWFVIGVLLGWLVIGWWLWPVQWSDAVPWHLSPQYQRTYVSLVADNYSQSANVAVATRALAGWNRADLANLLAAMQRETSDPLTQQQLANLMTVLQLPGAEVTLATSLSGQPIIMLGLLVAAVPLLIALAIVIVNLAGRQKSTDDEVLLQNGQSVIGVEPTVGDTAELFDEVTPQDWPIQPEENADDHHATDEQARSTSETANGGQQPAEQEQSQLAEQQPQKRPTAPAATPAEEQSAEQTKSSKPAASPGQPAKAEDSQPEEQSEEQEESAKAGLSDFMKLFEEEEDASISELGALAKDLAEVNVDELHDLGLHMLRRFRRGKRKIETVVGPTS